MIQAHVDYNPYVIFGHMTRPITVRTKSYGTLLYGGNQHFVPPAGGSSYVERAASRLDPYVEQNSQEFLDWIKG